ncbi:hypothetical protein B0H11DRAFT_1345753 [Mycena galericulata]|nr:hypothetical protein B0H11DRAFT_1345753 [Mycena galericulata]
MNFYRETQSSKVAYLLTIGAGVLLSTAASTLVSSEIPGCAHALSISVARPAFAPTSSCNLLPRSVGARATYSELRAARAFCYLRRHSTPRSPHSTVRTFPAIGSPYSAGCRHRHRR